MKEYKFNWVKKADPRYGWQYTAATMWETDEFRIWKGKYHINYSIYSSNEWHVERLSDHKVIYSAKTAKECIGAMEWAVRHGVDVYTDWRIPGLWDGVKFDDDFNAIR